MNASHWIIAAAAFLCAEPVQAGVNDPEVLMYRFPGVLDTGTVSFTGVATVFHCTNFSGVSENMRFVTRRKDGLLLSNQPLFINHLETKTVQTHGTFAYTGDLTLTTGLVSQGTMAIAATSTNIICTAMTIDASTVAPVGVALRGIRFNPVPGSQE